MANSFGSQGSLKVGNQEYLIHRLSAVEKAMPHAIQLPYSLKILLENLLRYEDGKVVTADEDGRQSPHGGPGPSDGSGAGARKKLRLTNEQSTLLEDTFRAHNILSNVCIPILSPFHGFHSISN